MLQEGTRFLVLVIGFTVIAVLGAFNNKFAGPFDVVVKQFADCEHPDKYIGKWPGNKIVKYNRTTLKYSTDMYLPVPFDDDVKLIATLAVFGNGGWRNNYFVINLKGACSAFIKYMPEMSKQLTDALGTKGCPIPPGNYTVKDVLLNLNVRWPSFVYNRYRIELGYERLGQDLFCKRVFVDIVPKKS